MLSALRNILARKPDAPIADRRSSPRDPCLIRARLFDADGLSTAATILDRSKGGVRVTCDESGFHARALYLLRSDTGAAYRLQLAWHGKNIAGYEFKGRVDGKPDGRDHALDALRVSWQERDLAKETNT